MHKLLKIIVFIALAANFYAPANAQTNGISAMPRWMGNRTTAVGDAIPCVPGQGAIYYDITLAKFKSCSGVNRWTALNGIMFVSTSSAAVSNTTTELSIVGGGVGTKTLPANLSIGDAFVVEGFGVFSTPALPGNALIKIKVGGVVIAQNTATGSLLTANSTNFGTRLRVLITVRTVGTSGSVVVSGTGKFTLSQTAGTEATLDFHNGGNPVTINTTIPNTIDVTCTWSNAQAGQSVIGTQATITKIN